MTSDKMPTGTTGGTPPVLLTHHPTQLKLPTSLRGSAPPASRR